MAKNKKIAIYKTKDNQIKLEVHLEKETIWLDQKSIANLFSVNIPAISKHISNIYEEKELSKSRTFSKMETVQKEGKRKVKRNIDMYNLDMIISVGYRVNSKRATEFRIWATNILRNYLIHGYALNKRRLQEDSRKYTLFKNQITLIQKTLENEKITLDQTKDLLDLIISYENGFNLIEKADKNELETPRKLSNENIRKISGTELRRDVDTLRKKLKTSELFGKETDDKLISILKTLFQTFNKKDLYPSIEEKASNLLYLIIKDHPFIDGNKRIATFAFIRFLTLNNIDTLLLFGENTIVALSLLIAQSDPKDKEWIIKLIINMIVLNKDKHE